jgi:hypothetical protein
MATCRRVRLLALLGLLLAPPASAQVVVNVQKFINLETLYLADLSPYTVGSQPEFVSITLTGAGSRQIRLAIELRRERPTASRLLTGTTDPFTLSGTLRLTNRDLACEDCPYGVEDGEISAEFEDIVRESSRFPAGSYVLEVRAQTPTGIEVGRGSTTFELVNPTRIELVSPGRPFGDTPEVVTSSTPRFVWSADAGVVSGGGDYRIRVVPVDGAATAEDAIQQFASWEASTRATTAIYPGSVSAIPLQPGGTYAWQIVRDVRASSGTEQIASPIYWFRMAEAQTGDDPSSQGNGGDVGAGNQLQQLARSLGIDLSGFRPTGQLYVDGELYPADRLEELLRAILAGEIPLSSINVR